MKRRTFIINPVAREDLKDIWWLIASRDGEDRANGVVASIEAFCRSLEEFSDIGTRHDNHSPGLRSVGVPGLRTAAVLFVVTANEVTVVRIGYLGRNIWDTRGQLIDG